MKSIKTKLILFSALLVVSTAALIGVIAISEGEKALKEEAGYSLQLLAAESAKLTQSRISSVISTLTMISKESELVGMGWEADTKVLLEELEKTDFLDIGYILPNGYTYFTDGTVRLMSDKTYVKDALDGKAGVSDVVISRVTRKPEIEAAVPIRKGKTVVAALIARMEADYLSGITGDIGYGEKGYAFIMNSSGTIIAHPDIQKVTQRYNPVQEGEDKAYRRILDEKAGSTAIRMAGEVIYAGFAPVGSTGWSFVVTAGEEEIMSAIPPSRKEEKLPCNRSQKTEAACCRGFLFCRSGKAISLPGQAFQPECWEWQWRAGDWLPLSSCHSRYHFPKQYSWNRYPSSVLRYYYCNAPWNSSPLNLFTASIVLSPQRYTLFVRSKYLI